MAFDSKGTVNKVILIGRLGHSPELKYISEGAACLNCSVATNTSYKDQAGNNVEQTEWHRVVAWRKLAEIIAEYAKKGNRIYVEGKLATRSWDDKNGVKHFITEVIADQIQILESAGDASGQSEKDDAAQEQQELKDTQDDGSIEDDLPF